MAIPRNPTMFVRDWVSSRTTKEIAQKHGVSVSTVSQWAAELRAEGVKLPPRRWTFSPRKPDVDTLNELIKESGRG